jgi:alanine dehydrogenase
MLANKGLANACRESAALRKGLNTHGGFITYLAVAEAFGMTSRFLAAEDLMR